MMTFYGPNMNIEQSFRLCCVTKTLAKAMNVNKSCENSYQNEKNFSDQMKQNEADLEKMSFFV